MKKVLPRFITLLLYMIIGFFSTLKAQDLDSIGRPKMANLAFFLVDYYNYELLGGHHYIFPCKGCPEGGLIYDEKKEYEPDGHRISLLLKGNGLNIAEYLTFVHFEPGSDLDFLIPFYWRGNNTGHPFKFIADSSNYNSLPDSFESDLSALNDIVINDSRISEQLDSVWALVSSSRMARRFTELPNYQVIFHIYDIT